MVIRKYIIGFKAGKQICQFKAKDVNVALEIDRMNCDYIGEVYIDDKL